MSSASYISTLLGKCQILCLQEHHLFAEHKALLKTIHQNFTGEVIVCTENKNSLNHIRKGGIAILWDKTIGNCVSDLELPIISDRIMGVQIHLENQSPIFIINVYMPSTNTSLLEYKQSIESLQIVTDFLYDKGLLLLCGDFNGQLGPKWGHRAGYFQNLRGGVLESFLFYNNMVSLISDEACGGPICTYWPNDTAYRPSQIDHILSTIDAKSSVIKSYVCDDHALNTSDHHAIGTLIKCDLVCYTPKIPTSYNWNKTDTTLYCQVLRQNIISKIGEKVISSGTKIDDYLYELQSCILDARDRTVLQSKPRKFKRPYWDSELKQLHITQKQLRQKWIIDGRPRGMSYSTFKDYKNAKRFFAKK